VNIFSRRSTPEIDIEELDGLLQAGAVRVLDVREDWEFKRGRVPGAISLPLGQLTSQAAGLARDKPYAVICESGSRSLSATDYLLGQGFEGAVSVQGGTGAWARSQRPIEKD
jgi:rhodanese-related sulfurtransferase